MTHTDDSVQPAYIAHQELARARKRHLARQRLRELQGIRSATPVPAREAKPSSGTLRPVGRTVEPLPSPMALVLGMVDRGIDLLLAALKPAGPVLVCAGLFSGVLGCLVCVGAWDVRSAASGASAARDDFFATLEVEQVLATELAMLGTRDDTLRVMALQLRSTAVPDERIERARALITASRDAWTRAARTTPAGLKPQVERTGERIERLSKALNRMEVSRDRWSLEANEGLGALAVRLGVAPAP